MKFKELELSNTEKLQVFCNFIVSNTIGSTTPNVLYGQLLVLNHSFVGTLIMIY